VIRTKLFRYFFVYFLRPLHRWRARTLRAEVTRASRLFNRSITSVDPTNRAKYTGYTLEARYPPLISQTYRIRRHLAHYAQRHLRTVISPQRAALLRAKSTLLPLLRASTKSKSSLVIFNSSFYKNRRSLLVSRQRRYIQRLLKLLFYRQRVLIRTIREISEQKGGMLKGGVPKNRYIRRRAATLSRRLRYLRQRTALSRRRVRRYQRKINSLMKVFLRRHRLRLNKTTALARQELS
jgi:hypothetical protein